MRLRAGFWLLVDMLSGRYLWNNLKLQDKKPSAEAIMKADEDARLQTSDCREHFE
jgi:hypothetical protein